MPTDALHRFGAATRAWFAASFPGPTPAQAGAWAAIGAGRHTLVVAPTGSGKTLAAFLWALDRIATDGQPTEPDRRCRVLYVSPMKALAVDVERNLRAPLTGIRAAAARSGSAPPDVTVAVRTGDTPADQRRRLARQPPDILITTPESLYLLLTSAARETLRGVRTVIVDEVHAVVGTKRGAHLAVSLERLDALLAAPAQRIGLSATVRPLDEVSRFLTGAGAAATVVAPAAEKEVRLEVVVPVADMSAPADEGERPSVWPAVEERIVDLVSAHRSTIVFANSRRLAERLTARLNEIAADRAEALEAGPVPGRGGAAGDADRSAAAPPAEVMAQAGQSRGTPAELARAHHGSVAREQRTEIEDSLKAGRLPAVVATSSLELGIDMGAVDLVVQVEPPPSVASGLQRVGRAGHHVGAPSTGVVFPKHRGELVSAAVVAERMRAGAIEALRYPRNALDVLAQQVVAMAAMDVWSVDALEATVRRAAPFAELPRSALEATLDMLAGRYPGDDFAELRPRLLWDRVAGTVQARPGAQRLAVTSGGTIPDRGLYGVFLVGEAGGRVGELDEEMVYESRVGDVFTLGSSSWRIEEITHDRVLVSPAPGVPGKLPFWHGDAPGRPVELGRAIGAFVRELGAMDEPAARRRLTEGGLDRWAADNLLALLAEQRAATGQLPDDRTVVVERFRDELGDWRLVVHTPFGARVHAPWGLALTARLRERYGVDVQTMHSDDGIVLRLPDVAEPPGAEDVLFDPDEVEALVQAEVGSSALFAARFRECAARALLLPRRDPRRRTPLWQQRQRSAQLLSVAARYPTFPVVLETMRECLQDVFDLPGLVELLGAVTARRVRVVEVETPAPSAFARSLLFGYVAAFMYEGDAPLAERRAQALSLDDRLLAELLGRAELRELLDADALAELESELQWLTARRRAYDLESAADLFRVVGDLSDAEAAERGVPAEWLAELAAQRRLLRLPIAGEQRWVAAEDAARMRDALGTPMPVGVPTAFLEPVADPLADLVGRFARTHGPFRSTAAAERLGLGVAVVEQALHRLAASGRLVQGEFRPGGRGLEWCDAEVLRMLRRRSLARLRREVEPVEPAALAAFLPAWQGVGGRARGVDAVLRAVEQLAGSAVPASVLESLVLPARVADYTPGLLDELTTAGEVLWAGAGALPNGDGWVSLCPADRAELLLPDPGELEPGPLHRAVLEALSGEQALFFRTLSDRVGSLDDNALAGAVWDLVWAGVLTNDTLAPLRAAGTGPRRRPGGLPRPRYARPRTVRRSGPPAMAGRWSRLPERDPEATRRAHAAAEALLDRYGVLTRGAVAAERPPGGFARIYRVLRAFEDSGHCRRGYFVAGLGAAQFAVPGAVDRLRSVLTDPGPAPPAGRSPTPGGWSEPAPRRGQGAVLLAAADPAQPYGAALPWPSREAERAGGGAGRKAGATVVLVGGRLVLYVERGGRSLLSYTDDADDLAAAVDALAGAVRAGRVAALRVERADGSPVPRPAADPLTSALLTAGFAATPGGLRLRA